MHQDSIEKGFCLIQTHQCWLIFREYLLVNNLVLFHLQVFRGMAYYKMWFFKTKRISANRLVSLFSIHGSHRHTQSRICIFLFSYLPEKVNQVCNHLYIYSNFSPRIVRKKKKNRKSRKILQHAPFGREAMKCSSQMHNYC